MARMQATVEHPSRARPAWGRTAAALGLLLLWQALFWLLVHAAERVARTPLMDGRSEVAYELLDAAGQLAQPGPAWARRDGLDGFPVSAARSDETARIRFRVPFEVQDPGQPLALYLAIREQVVQVRLNAQVLQTSAPLPRLEGLLTSEPGLYELPAGALRPGTNLLEVEKELVGFDSALSEFAIGPRDALAESFRWKTLLVTDLPLVGVGVLLFTLLLCLAVNWPPVDRPRIRALMLLLGCCAVSTWFLTFNPPLALSLFGWIAVWCAINLLTAVAIALYVWFDAGPGPLRSRWFAPALAALASVFALGFLIAARDENPRAWLFLLMHSAYWLVILSVLVALALLAAGVARDRGARWFERSLLALCISALAMDRLGSLYDLHSPFDAGLPLSLPWSPLIGAVLGLSIVLALAREAAEARRTVLDANRVLAQALAEREIQLAASFAERNEILRRSAVLEERGRIVRDIHDGVGGQLVRLQAQVRSQPVDADALAAALEDSLGDLRLIVDALDSAEDGLHDALVGFERRLRQQAGGCQITSEYALEDASDRVGARVTLQVLRILQESVSNALRHGKATSIRLGAATEPDSGRVLIALRDNGGGVSSAAAPGRGLSNMRQRAEAIGADLEVRSDATGTEIRLRLAPVRADQARPMDTATPV